MLSRLLEPGGREDILEIFRMLRELEIAWEFSTGFEIGKLADVEGRVDYELIDAMFGSRMIDGRFVGCYRAYIPVETLRDDGPRKFKKLRPWEIEKDILRSVTAAGLPASGYGIMIGLVDDSPEALKLTMARCEELREACEDANPKAIQHFQIFNNIPLPGTPNFRKHFNRARYDVNTDPELWNFYTSVLDGDHFEYWENLRERQVLDMSLNGQQARSNWNSAGKYY